MKEAGERSDLIGLSVESPDGKILGKVEDVHTDPESGGEILILSLRGAQWEKDRWFGVPREVTEHDPERNRIVWTADPEMLGKVPITVDKTTPGLSGKDTAEVRRVYGAAHWQERYFGEKTGPTQQGGHKKPSGLTG